MARVAMKWLASLACAVAIAGCSLLPGPPRAAWGDRVPTPDPAAFASQPIVARGPDSITLLAISPRGAAIGVPYGFDMPHCGVLGAIDVDGSFWDAVGVLPDPVAFDGQPGTFRLTASDTAVFTRSDGMRLNLVRHVGAKEFPFCA